MRLAGSKSGAPPPRLGDLGDAAHDELVDHGGLPLARPQEPADALDVFSFALRTTHHDGDVGVRDVDPLVEDACRNQSAWTLPSAI